MKVQSIVIMALAAGSLMAQEAPRVDARIQLFAELSRPAQIVVAQTPGDVKDQPGNQTGIGVRFLGEIASAPNWYYEVGGMFDASSKFRLSNGSADLTDVKVTDSYWSVGAAYNLAPFTFVLSYVNTNAAAKALFYNAAADNRWSGTVLWRF